MRIWLLVGIVAVSGFLLSAQRAEARRRIADPAVEAAAEWPRSEVMRAALRAYRCGEAEGYFTRPLLTVIDYSLPSTEKRLWVIDLMRRRLLFHELVAHGANSGGNLATDFSDRPGSRMSSIGLFRTAETYVGKHGLSLRLDGLEPGYNQRARERSIVLHGAPYVSHAAIGQLNQLGRSWGCPAVPTAAHQQIIDRIGGGTALFVYYPDHHWLSDSEFLHCPATTQVARNDARGLY